MYKLAIRSSFSAVNGASNAFSLPLTVSSFFDAYPWLSANRVVINSTVYSAFPIALFGALDGVMELHESKSMVLLRRIFNITNNATNAWLFMLLFVDEVYSTYLCQEIIDNQCYAPDWVYFTVMGFVSLFGIAEVVKCLLQDKYKDNRRFQRLATLLECVQNASIVQVFPTLFIPFNIKTVKLQTGIFLGSILAGTTPSILKNIKFFSPGKVDGAVWVASSAACFLWFVQYLISNRDGLAFEFAAWGLLVGLMLLTSGTAFAWGLKKHAIKSEETPLLDDRKLSINSSNNGWLHRISDILCCGFFRVTQEVGTLPPKPMENPTFSHSSYTHA